MIQLPPQLTLKLDSYDNLMNSIEIPVALKVNVSEFIRMDQIIGPTKAAAIDSYMGCNLTKMFAGLQNRLQTAVDKIHFNVSRSGIDFTSIFNQK